MKTVSVALRLLPLVLVLFDVAECILFYQGRTTACDICDGVSTNSVRNIMCCLKFSKCCMPNTLDEYNAQADREARSGLVNFPDRSEVPVVTPTTLPKATASNNKSNKRKRKSSKTRRKASEPKQQQQQQQRQQRYAQRMMQTINQYFISLS